MQQLVARLFGIEVSSPIHVDYKLNRLDPPFAMAIAQDMIKKKNGVNQFGLLADSGLKRENRGFPNRCMYLLHFTRKQPDLLKQKVTYKTDVDKVGLKVSTCVIDR